MSRTINAKELRSTLSKIVESVRRGEQYTVIYRSRPAFRIVPIDGEERISCPLEKDPLYGAAPVGESIDGLSAADHDMILYGDQKK
ncbi:MAG: type II toxin-antitoxin system prevent-host-death family antitoxin [Desulfobacterales bacterium]|nr:type II toxin-antitoxin system prevent-host-death family antitoxin [Desulfobacterales bacterium]